MYNLAQKCMQLKPPSSIHKLTGLMIGILGENTEVIAEILIVHAPLLLSLLKYLGLLMLLSLLCYLIHPLRPILKIERFEMSQVVLAECSREFGPW